jgi:tRNA(Ile)-lysidine synthase
VLREFRNYINRHALLKPGDRVGVAVSGGADSVALLRALEEAREELGIVLSIAHFNHQLRGDESQGDQEFVAELAARFDVPFLCEAADTRRFAREKELSLEAAAREVRYNFFGRLIREKQLDRIATAHTVDDQAETVLLRIFRGTGTSGLAGILPKLKAGDGAVVRPFLSTSRAAVRDYLDTLKQPWREDSSNSEIVFMRNRVRHELLPMLKESFNPDVIEALCNLAEVARVEDEFWTPATAEAFVHCVDQGRIDSDRFRNLPLAVRRRVIRLAGIQRGVAMDFAHTERVLDLLAKGSNQERAVELPNGFRAVQSGHELWFETSKPQAKPCGFTHSLAIPGEVRIPELRIVVRTTVMAKTAALDGYNDDRRLALRRMPSELLIRNWRSGDRFWPAHTRSERKVKELLVERHLPAREKAIWPVALAGDKIVWMRGFPVSSQFIARDEDAVVIEDLPFTPEYVP